MPRQYTAQEVKSINPLHFEQKQGVVTGLIVNCEVNYGEIGMTHQIDLWGDLTDYQREWAQKLYNFVKARIEAIIMGD